MAGHRRSSSESDAVALEPLPSPSAPKNTPSPSPTSSEGSPDKDRGEPSGSPSPDRGEHVVERASSPPGSARRWFWKAGQWHSRSHSRTTSAPEPSPSPPMEPAPFAEAPPELDLPDEVAAGAPDAAPSAMQEEGGAAAAEHDQAATPSSAVAVAFASPVGTPSTAVATVLPQLARPDVLDQQMVPEDTPEVGEPQAFTSRSSPELTLRRRGRGGMKATLTRLGLGPSEEAGSLREDQPEGSPRLSRSLTDGASIRRGGDESADREHAGSWIRALVGRPLTSGRLKEGGASHHSLADSFISASASGPSLAEQEKEESDAEVTPTRRQQSSAKAAPSRRQVSFPARARARATLQRSGSLPNTGSSRLDDGSIGLRRRNRSRSPGDSPKARAATTGPPPMSPSEGNFDIEQSATAPEPRRQLSRYISSRIFGTQEAEGLDSASATAAAALASVAGGSVSSSSSWPFKPSSLIGARDIKRSIDWYKATATDIIDNMIPTDADRRAPRQEFELADILHAAAKGSDLSVYLAEMPIFFWIFIIAGVYNIVYLAEALTAVWLDEVIAQLGYPAYLPLFATSLISWPVFIRYLVQTFIAAYRVTTLQQRTVQIYGRAGDHLAVGRLYQEMSGDSRLNDCVCQQPEEGHPSEVNRCLLEIVFPTREAMKVAFRDEILTHTLRLDSGGLARCRPKLGKNTAIVEMWLVVFEYLRESVSERYWLRATISCLVTMSLMRHLARGLTGAIAGLRSWVGLLGMVVSKLVAFVSVLCVFFFVGYHAYREMVDARDDIRKEARPHRRHDV